MDAISLIGAVSVLAVGLCMGMGSIGPALGEAKAAESAIRAMAQQPDESNNFFKTMLISMAMIESTAIYCLFICMLLLFANPFWKHVADVAAS
jgi:F-type H+-transporting ATPase subunit c